MAPAVIALDSSFLIGFHNEGDAQHQAAQAMMGAFLDGKWGQRLLLEHVFLEVVTVLLLRPTLGSPLVGRLLLNPRELEFVPCSDLFVDALDAFSLQSGSGWNFTDAALAAVARRRGDGQILTFGKKFRRLSSLRVQPESR